MILHLIVTLLLNDGYIPDKIREKRKDIHNSFIHEQHCVLSHHFILLHFNDIIWKTKIF
jgi:hypothetical protein